MGAVSSSNLLSMTLRNHKSRDVFYPQKRYIPLSVPSASEYERDDSEKTSGDLIAEIPVVPDECSAISSSDYYWYVEASFLPNDDSKIVVSSASYHMLPHRQVDCLHASKFPKGRIYIIDLNKPQLDYYKIRGTASSSLPKLTIHPSGEFIGYVGVGEVNITTIDSEKVYTKQKDITNASFQNIAIAPNGVNIAVITKNQGKYKLHISMLTLMQMYLDNGVFCHNLCPGFSSQQTINNGVNFMWSPDSLYLAISSDTGMLFILQKFTMTNICTVFEEIVEGRLSNNTGFDFNPRFNHSVMAVAIREEEEVHIIDIITKRTLNVLMPCEDGDVNSIDCIKYHPDGHSVAISLHSLNIVIMCVESCSRIQNIDMKQYLTGAIMGYDLKDQNVLGLAYSADGRFLLSSCCDGMVRIWNVASQTQTLMTLCRFKIMTLMKMSQIKKAELPNKVKDFLLKTPVKLE